MTDFSGEAERGAAQGRIILAATPIGNAGDASQRLREAIMEADIVAAEDTRRFRNFCSRLGLEAPAKVVAIHDHNEADRVQGLLEEVQEGKVVLVVSDAGTPTVSDPGYHLVRGAIEADAEIVTLPGPSAALAALSVSGLPTDRFVFEGFLPRKGSGRNQRLELLAKEPRTIVLFESPRRTAATLEDLATRLGQTRQAALCRELTKTHEEVRRGTLGDLAEGAREREVLGEVTIVIGGAPQDRDQTDPTEIGRSVVRTAEREGLRLKDAAALVAHREGIRKNQAMQAALEYSAQGDQETEL